MRQPVCVRSPVVASRANDRTELLEAAAAYTYLPSGETTTASAPRSASPFVHRRSFPSSLMQPMGVSSPVAGSRLNSETASESAAATYALSPSGERAIEDAPLSARALTHVLTGRTQPTCFSAPVSVFRAKIAIPPLPAAAA